MDITNNPNPEPSHEPDGGVPPAEAGSAADAKPSLDEQETPGLFAHTESVGTEVETLVLPHASEPPAEEAMPPLTAAEPAGAEAETPDVANDPEAAGAEAAQLSPLDTAEDALVLSETGGATPLATLPDTLDTGSVVRTKRRSALWLQILGALLLVCLVGGMALAVGRAGGVSAPAPQTHRLPTPVVPLKVTAWCQVASAAVDSRLGSVNLLKVVALAASDVWMLGTTSNEKTRQTFPLLEHWNGATWQVIPTADTSALLTQLLKQAGRGKASENVSLSDIAALSDRNIWAVGLASVAVVSPQVTSSGGLPVMFGSRSGKPLIEHWDGRTWQIVASPGGFTGGPAMSDLSTNTLTSISAVSANDIWAVGSQASKNEQTVTVNGQTFKIALGGPSVPLVEHWDGKSWTERKLPASLSKSTFTTLNNVQAFASNDVWSFGTGLSPGFVVLQPGLQPTRVVSPAFVPPTGNGVSLLSYLLHWDGQSWKKMKLPATNVGLRDVHIISGHDIWLITDSGLLGGKAGSLLNTVYHWDGTTWHKVPEVNSADPESILDSFSVIAPDNVWLLGHTGKNRPLLEHWDGKTWSPVSPTTPAYGSVQSMAIAGNHAWAVVSVYDAKSAQKAGPYVFVTATGSMLETNC
ncbi:MAG TPA: hypothetical protein VGF67_13105 [Ktedonobacteraceae bacterium]|jgi:hypothetical protein